MKQKNIAWLYFVVGGLWLIVVLRDLLAPGFFAMNNRVVGRGDIIVEVTASVVFLTIGVLTYRRHRLAGVEKH